ncbi:MAG: CPBP family intramembrane metalloprotease [Gammaproteobacteria bacterium]|nr:CPBP family intramembrane metalloprotease [Gammaproteobacteria bacterium]MCW8839456.1 CPBP family intramembrane metalloprotease [Gammaproteobacteria bacterium]MCW8959803.1 CPBP family intramembrane metalloprotease [Gammaproteobacteria bacterium]MCW8972035.1 CPBP family intramembrane metalloprotease [Gammaproteobacteria bacterium]MCW8993199.1 CPBP family intramembrane metalloprotease [Gammaproteobacteria bacterium]
MHQRDLVPFFSMTFVIAWGILGLYIFVPDRMVRLFGNLTGEHPLFHLAVYAPAIAALTLVLYRHGFVGVGRFLSRLLLWRATRYWYALILVIIPLVFYVSALLKENEYDSLFPFASVQAYLLALLLMAIKGPVEEIGWRGLALPLLQRRMTPIWAALVLGVVWALWHYPAFLLSGTPQSAWSVTPFFLGTMALSIIVTPLFNSSRGSILLPALFHLQLINPLWPDAQPYDTWLFVVVAMLVVWFNRAAMFSRHAAITEVFPRRSAITDER